MIDLPKAGLDSTVRRKMDEIAKRYQSQSDKFKEAAREHEADEDEARWDERLGKLVKVKPKPEKPE